MNKILILDFDGVLFPRRFVFLDSGADPVLVQTLNLAGAKGWRIAISSTAALRGRDFCQEQLNKAGVTTELVDGDLWSIYNDNPYNGPNSRALAITHYLQEKCKLDLNSDHTRIFIFEDCFKPTPLLLPYWIDCDEQDGVSFHLLTYLNTELTSE